MTKVRIEFGRLQVNGSLAPVRGIITAQPTKALNAGHATVVPDPFTTMLDDNGKAVMELAPTTGEWAWSVSIVIDGSRQWQEFVKVPDSVAELTWDSLIRLSPQSFQPGAVPEDAWWNLAHSNTIGGVVTPDGFLVMQRADGTTTNAGKVKGDRGEKGDPGDKGDPGKDGEDGAPGADGSNVLPTDTAVANALSGNGLARQVLDSVTVSKISGFGINAIEVTKDPNPPAVDGKLWIIVETPRHFTDFGQYTVGAAPSDWVQQWVAAAFTVESDAGASAGKVLRQVAGTTGRRVLAWSPTNADASTYADAEIVFKWRASATDSSPRAVLRGSGSATLENGYYGGHSASRQSVQVGVYNNGVAGTAGDSPVGVFVANTWYITRFRVEGSSIKARTWLATDPEPATWQATKTDTSIPGPGWVGLLPWGSGTKDYDWVGIAFDGSPAPMEAI